MKTVSVEKNKSKKNQLGKKLGESRRQRLLSFLMVFSLIFNIGMDLRVFAVEDVSVSISGGGAVQYQGIITIVVKVNNKKDSEISINGGVLDKGNIPGSATLKTVLPLSIAAESSAEISWDVDVYGLPMGVTHWVRATIVSSVGSIQTNDTNISVTPIDDEDIGKPNLPTIDEKDYTFKPDDTVNYNSQVKMEVIAPSGGLNAGAVSNIQLKVTNTGNAPFNKVVAAASGLGDKMSLKNSSVEKDLGPMGKLKEASVTFPVYVENSHQGGNVPISFTVKATDPKGAVNEFSITEYVLVNGGSSLADQLEITNISNPPRVNPDQDFTLSFAVRNSSSREAKNVKISVEPTNPLVNKTKNIFVVNLAQGESKSFGVDMFVPASAEGVAQNYPIKITAETTGSDASSISQYTGVFVNTSTDKTVPQIIISNYGYGGISAVANQVFPLSLTLKNTNASQTLKNIKVSINAEEGVFIPHDSSNSFYIPQIGPQGSMVKTIQMMTIPEAPEKTVGINVDMSYEDEKGNQISVKDIISVPVVQQRRLEIDDIHTMEELFVGQQANISVQYYNLGKSTLNNLIISVEGDFDFPQSTKSFVGKLEPGKNDYYDLSLIPLHEGEADGKLIFSFEDSSGKEILLEKPFRLTAVEMPPMEPMDDFPMEESGMSNQKKIGIGVGLLVLGAGAFYMRKKKKDKDKDIFQIDIDDEE